jgi:hypothetical protein
MTSPRIRDYSLHRYELSAQPFDSVTSNGVGHSAKRLTMGAEDLAEIEVRIISTVSESPSSVSLVDDYTTVGQESPIVLNRVD